MLRRTFLRAWTVVATTSTTGCLSAFALDGRVSGEARLAAVRLVNGDSSGGHAVELVVRRDGTTVHEGTYDLSTSGERENAVSVQGAWSADPGRYVVRARVDGDEWVETALSDPGCYVVEGFVNWHGHPQFDDPRQVDCRSGG